MASLADMIRMQSSAPILAAAAPYQSELALNDSRLKNEACLRDHRFLDAVVGSAKSAAERVFQRRRCELIWQNAETIAQPGFTKAEFSLNATRFNANGSVAPISDMKHGNEDYGSIVLESLFRRLDELSNGRVLARSTSEKTEQAIS